MAEQVDSYERALALVRAGKSEELRKMLRGEEVAPGDKDSSGRTLLHHAAEVGEPATIDALLGCGAQPNVVDCNGKTPADVALEHSKFAAAQRLAQSNGEATYYREHPALAWKRVLELKGKERLRGIETLSLLGIDPNAVVMGKLTPLVCVVMEDDIAAARCLIKQGADVRCETNRGRTALHWAAWRSSPEMVQLLLDYGADAGAATEGGWLPLDWAKIAGRRENAKLLEQYARGA